ncbi:MAG: hypothetical protein AAF993_00405 [Pseudomonadota bacterium]
MNISFSRSVLFAFLAAVLGTGFMSLLQLTASAPLAWHWVITAAAGAYIVFIMWSCGARVGRVAVPLFWLLVSPVWFLLDSLFVFALVHTGLLWLVRCIYLHRSLLAITGDLFLSAAALGFALWAFAGGNVLLTLWAYFLIHSLVVWLPRGSAREPAANSQQRSFAAAADKAHNALNQILQHSNSSTLK